MTRIRASIVTLAAGLTLIPVSALAADRLPPPTVLLGEAYRAKASGDLQAAARSFEQARSAGADGQRTALELGYVHNGLGRVAAARAEFTSAAAGPDATLAGQARRELAQLPQRWWADVYAEAYGWQRAAGANQARDLVPTVRLRGHLRLAFAWDADAFLYAQGTRDTASRGRDQAGVPSLYADNHALAGAGLLVRTWQRRVGLFFQGGPAFNLIDDGRARLDWDVRGGAFLGLETAACRPGARAGVRLHLRFCADVYVDGTYASRFQHNVIGFARGHAGLAYLQTGPVAWQLLVGARSSVDHNADFYNNFADAGLFHRWRLGGPLPFDLVFGSAGGRYLGRSGRDPAPGELRYLDLRLLAVTYLEF
jgi:hypothetical protein